MDLAHHCNKSDNAQNRLMPLVVRARVHLRLSVILELVHVTSELVIDVELVYLPSSFAPFRFLTRSTPPFLLIVLLRIETFPILVRTCVPLAGTHVLARTPYAF